MFSILFQYVPYFSMFVFLLFYVSPCLEGRYALQTLQNIRAHEPLISNWSEETLWYFAIFRRRLTPNIGATRAL
jgi:hypothetical protein